jgi:hypothetical protein
MGFGFITEYLVLDRFTARDYTLHITITHRPVLSVTLFGNAFQWRTFLCFLAHVLTGWRPSHANLIYSAGYSWYFPQSLAPGLDSPTAASKLEADSL